MYILRSTYCIVSVSETVKAKLIFSTFTKTDITAYIKIIKYVDVALSDLVVFVFANTAF